MAKYPEQTPKVLNGSGHVGMKEQMACAAKPHGTFQEKGMKNGGFVKGGAANPAAPAVPEAPAHVNPFAARFGKKGG